MRDAVPECGNFRRKAKMAVGVQENLFASPKTKVDLLSSLFINHF